MKLTPRERALAKMSIDYRSNREEINRLVDDLLLRGEKQALVRELFGLSWTGIDKRARQLDLPRVNEVSMVALTEAIRNAVNSKLQPGQKFWPQAEARKMFGCSSKSLARVKAILVREKLLEQVDPWNVNRGYRRVK